MGFTGLEILIPRFSNILNIKAQIKKTEYRISSFLLFIFISEENSKAPIRI